MTKICYFGFLSLRIDNLEIVWGLIRPKNTIQGSQFKVILAASFYLPPKSRMKTKLFDHMASTVQLLLCKYPQAGLLLGGDRNEFSIEPLLSIAPRLVQMVHLPTRGNKILDVLISNMSHLYITPVIHRPVDPDSDYPNHKPSDHSVPVVYPLSSWQEKPRHYKLRKHRPLPESAIKSFGQ